MYYQKSKFLHHYEIQNGKYAFLHSINQEIIFGNQKLRNFFESCNKPISAKNIKAIISDDALFGYLVKYHLLVSSKAKENISDEIKISHGGNHRKGYSLLRIMLTDLCNLNCRYCKVEKNIKKITTDPVSTDNLNNIVKFFFDKSAVTEPKVIHITGGEPTIFWNKIEKIVSFVNFYKRKKEAFFIVIGTNSILLDQEKIQFIKKNNIKVIVSIDGKKIHHDVSRILYDGRGTFDSVDNKIKELKEAGCEVGLSMVIGRHNYNHLDEIIDYFIKIYNPASLGVNFMKQPSVHNCKEFPFLITPEDYVNSVYEAYRKYRNKGLFLELPYRKINPFVEKKFRLFDCGAAAGSTINIDSKGNIGPCKSFLIMAQVFSAEIGNNNMSNILHSFRDRTVINNRICQTCPAIAICGNGCAYSAYIDSGDFMSVDKSACCYSKLFHKAIVEDLYSILHKEINNDEYYTPTMKDRKKLFGTVKINKSTLASSIGHETQ